MFSSWLKSKTLPAGRKGADLVYVGSVGTGFTEKAAWKLRGMMDRIKRKTPPIHYAGRRKDVVWLQPTLISEIEYRAWTDDGKLRLRPTKECERSRMVDRLSN
ncbi:hypothetical protein E0J18_12030 [Rhizobium leguminosarum bv. viciae]|nr:hypothetical protein E0J18_12030 [Rhizobium leguminosarum bv. viciae]